MLKTGARYIVRGFAANGIDVRRLFRGCIYFPRFLRDLMVYRRAAKGNRAFRPSWLTLYPCLADYVDHSGIAEGHYFHQDLYFARKIFERGPQWHVDIGSRVDGFVAHVLTFMPVEYVDIRPLTSRVAGLTFTQSNATELAEFETGSLQSVSTLHAAEHFGLGRYSDPIDPDSCFRFMASLARVLAPGGRLYFSVPVGRERVEFNAHRIFAPQTILEAFATLKLVSFSAVLDDGHL